MNATNEMSGHMRELLTKINVVSGTVNAQSEELTQSSNEVTIGAERDRGYDAGWQLAL